jgi:hypothetical protein
LRIVFWAAVVVFLSALFGVGYKPVSIRVDLAESGRGLNGSGPGWKSMVPGEGGIEGIWKGVEVMDRSGWNSNRHLEGIWEGERSVRR